MRGVAVYRLQGREIETFLAEGASSIGLSVEVAISEQFPKGSFFAIAPENLTMERLRKFSTGGLTPQGRTVHQGKYRMVEKLRLDEDFAKEILFAVAAYDGESFVYWRRNR